MAIVIEKPGLATTVQDLGRFGFQDRGFSPAGVMDWRAASLGNALVDNATQAAVIEFALMGPDITFEHAGVFALTGAQVEATLNGRTITAYRAYAAPAGSVLHTGSALQGQFGYICLAGGVCTPPAMGSRSTSVRYGLGGYEGRTLRAGDRLEIGPCQADIPTLPAMEARAVWAEDSFYAWSSDVTWLRVVPGPNDRAFEAQSVYDFYHEPFCVTPRSDRMGLRLAGPRLHLAQMASMASEGIALGTIQVPVSGDPIAVMADHQTVGGYRKIATVITSDLPRLAQCAPGRRVRFESVSVEKAQELLHSDASWIAHVRESIARAARAEGESHEHSAR